MREIGYLAVGASKENSSSLSRAVAARRAAFAAVIPEIVEFSVDGGPDADVDYLDTVSIDYKINDAWRYEIVKLAGAGPDPGDSGSLVYGEPVNGSMQLVFDTDAINDAILPAVGSAAIVDDRNPGLVLYEATSAGEPGRLAGIGIGVTLITAMPVIMGQNWMSDYEWEGHCNVTCSSSGYRPM